jgi:RNA polymerase sigma-70 factor (ECF subfamily)
MDQARRDVIQRAMVRLAEGERAAYPDLVRELWPVLQAFVRRGIRHPEDAEDVAQEVFLRICARISELDCSRDGLSWAFGIASYQIMTHRRRQQRRRESFGDQQFERHAHPAPSLEAIALQQELTAALTETIGALSTEDRVALGVAPSEGAERAADATLRKRRQRALERLRHLWRTLHGEP